MCCFDILHVHYNLILLHNIQDPLVFLLGLVQQSYSLEVVCHLVQICKILRNYTSG